MGRATSSFSTDSTMGNVPVAGDDPPFVIVEWADAWGGSHVPVATADVGQEHKPIVPRTAGWLLKEDAEGLTLFSERYMDDGTTMWRGRSFIPRVLVRSVTVVRLARVRRKSRTGGEEKP